MHPILARRLGRPPLLSLMWCLSVSLTVGLGAESPLFPDQVLVRGKGIEIRQSQLDDAITTLKATAAARNQPIPESRPGEIATKLLDRLIMNGMLRQKATDEDKAKAKVAADKLFEEERQKAPSDASFKRQLLATGMTIEAFKTRLLEQALDEKVIERELKAKLSVTPAQIKDFYEQGLDGGVRALAGTVEQLAKNSPNSTFYQEGKKRLEESKKANLARLNRPEQVTASHILLYGISRDTREVLPEETRKQKKELGVKTLARVKAGEDFEKVAREVSEDPEVKNNGGEYTVTRETPMLPELQSALFSLAVNQVSDVVETQYGWHILKVHEHVPAGKIPLAKAEKDIIEYLLNQEVGRKLPDYFEQLKKEFGVEIKVPTPE